MGLTVLFIFIICAFYVQNRGDVQHNKLIRKISDHSNIFGPINCLFYGFSTIKKSVYIDVGHFPELKVLKDNWKVIRDEAVRLNDDTQIKSSKEKDLEVLFDSDCVLPLRLLFLVHNYSLYKLPLVIQSCSFVG